jgi:hypothetical protein
LAKVEVEVFFHAHQVAAAAGNDIDHGLARSLAGAERILVGVDVDALVGIGEVGALGEARWASVRMGILASAEAPAAKRKKVRREKPLQPVGSTRCSWATLLESKMGSKRWEGLTWHHISRYR